MDADSPRPLRREPIIEAFAQELRRRSPRGVALVGPPWSGGTLLGANLLRVAEDLGWQTLVLRAAPGLRDIPFGALAPLLQATGTPAIDLTGLGEARDAINRYLDRGRLVIMIDDAQWLDDLTAAVVGQLSLDALVPILVVSTATPDALPPGARALLRDRAIVRHDLAPLDEQAIRQVIDLAAGAEVDPLTKHNIVTRANGLPALAAELTTEAVRAGSIRPDGNLLRQRGEIDIPPAIAERVSLDLSDIPDSVRRAVEVLAVVGELPHELAAAAVGTDALAESGRLGLIDLRIDGDRHVVQISRALVGDVVRQRLPPIRRVELARAVRACVDQSPGQWQDEPVLLGLLTLIAGEPVDPDDAMLWAGRATTLGRTHLALRFAAEANAKRPNDPTAACMRADLLVLEGRSREAEQLLADLDPDEDDSLALVAMTRANNLFFSLEEMDLADRVLEDALDRLSGTPWQAELHGLAAVFTLFRGYPEEAIERVRPQLASEEGRNLVEAITASSPALVMAGRPEQAAELARRGFDERVALGDQINLAHAGIHLVARSLALGEAGHLEEAIDFAQLVRTGAEAEGTRDGMFWATIVGGRSLLTMGRFDDSLSWFRTASGLASELGLRRQFRWALSGVVLSLAMQRREGEMNQALLELDLAPESVARLMVNESNRAVAWAAAVSGDLPMAREHLRAGAEEALSMGQTLIALLALHDAVRLDLDLPIEQLTVVASQVEGPLAAARLRHGVAMADGNATEAFGASEDFEVLGANILAAEAAMQAAALASREGQQRAAERWRHRAHQLQQRCQGAATPALAWNDRASSLTRREREVALSAASGLPSKEIASQFGISVRTVNNLLQRVYRKLGVHDRAEMAAELTKRDGR